MNMVRAVVEMTWDIFWEDMVELYNFRCPKAKICCKKVTDHHKGWTQLVLAHESLVKALYLPYVRNSLSMNKSVSLQVYDILFFSSLSDTMIR